MKTLDPPTRRGAGFAPERTGTRLRRPATWHTPGTWESHAEWALVQRIVSSGRFGRSTLLSDFLLFVSHRSLSGRANDINEQQIGVHVFGRGQDFKSGDDNIVRSYARMLRKRLQEYFSHEGKDEELGVEIPRGAYVPLFSPRRVSEATLAPALRELKSGNDAAAVEPPRFANPEFISAYPAAPGILNTEGHSPAKPPERKRSALFLIGLLLAGMLLGIAAGFGLAHWRSDHAAPGQGADEQLSHLLWQQIFGSKSDTYIVPTDGGLVILLRFLERPVSLSDYVSGRYKAEPAIAQGLEHLLHKSDLQNSPDLTHRVATLAERRYTSIADLELTTQLARRREVVPERLMIRYARDLRMDDLHSANAILIGSIDSNPWVELFQPQLNFQFTHGASFGGSGIIVNRQPLPGEQPAYASVTGDPAQRTYGVIAYVPNLDGNGHVLIVEGINMAGTEAAGNFLLSADKMQPVLMRALSSKGILRSFEVLLSTQSIAANSSRVEVLSERVAGAP